MNLLLDTNILLMLSRNQNLELLAKIITTDREKVFVSVASIGELKSIALQNNWGEKKRQIVDQLLSEIIIIEITENFVDTYAEIDAFSQCRNPAYINYPSRTPRNMGKNDLWIASTAALFGLKLVTTDADFNHLNQVFLEVHYLKPELFK